MKHKQVALVTIGLLSILGTAVARAHPAGSAPASTVPNPPGNVAANPNYYNSCGYGATIVDTPPCDAAALAAINNARKGEGVKPMTLPGNYAQLPDEQKMLVVFNLERTDRGLAPIEGTTADYDALAQQGADAADDPPFPANYPATSTTGDESGIWATQPNVLTADYLWMYVDGCDAGAANGDCATNPADAWGHRDSILGSYDNLPNVVIGAAVNPTAANGHPSLAALFEAFDGPAPALKYSAGTPAPPVPQPQPNIPTCPAGNAPPGGPIQRIAGDGRDDTAILVSKDAFPDPQSAKAVVLASDANFPDALTGGPLAVKDEGPLLITPPSGLTAAVEAEIKRALPSGGPVYVLGGTFALAASVDQQLGADGFHVTRIAGANRMATAVAIADAMGDPATVFEASGLNFPDALAAAPAAASAGGAILLTAGATQAPETAAYLGHAKTRYAVGGPAAQADPSATAVTGANRYETAIAVDQKFLPNPATIGFATGAQFPDALAGAARVAAQDGALVLVPKCLPLDDAITGYLHGRATNGPLVALLFGGTFAVTNDVQTALDTALQSTT